jgi:drug/metabolite transporter (DMT)-like permease
LAEIGLCRLPPAANVGSDRSESDVTETTNRAMMPREWGLIFLLSLLWGGSFFFTGVAVRELPPLTIVVLRVGLATLTLLAIVNALGLRMPRDRASWTAFAAMGLINNVAPFCLLVWGQTHIASGLASILNATTPLWTVVVAHALTPDEKMTAPRLAGVALGFVGVVVMLGPVTRAGLSENLLAQLACLGAALSYAFAGVFGRRFKRMGLAPIPTAAGQVAASSLMLLPVALAVDRPWLLAMPSLAAWGAVFGIAALSTALAYVIYFRILATAGATNLMLVTFLIPVSGIVLGAMVLGEQLERSDFFGMGLIGLGLVTIDGRVLAGLRALPPHPLRISRRLP